MRYKKVFDRRRFLRGAGTVAIGLPLLDEMLRTSAYAALPEPPARIITVFFALGLPKPIQAEGFSGPMRPLAEFSDKLAFVRGLTMNGVESPINNHLDGGAGVFVGFQPQSNARAGGPSIDQVFRREVYPEAPPTPIKQLSIGTSFRRTGLVRHVHTWHEDGSPADTPVESPVALFSRLFGDPGTGMNDPEKRHQRSILDSVLIQYRALTSGRSPLSQKSQQRLSDHLDKIRELERQVFPPPVEMMCARADHPGDPPLLHGQPTGGSGPRIDVDEWQDYWRLMVDLYAIGLRCDLYRIGNVSFQSAGDRVQLQGDYRYGGELVASFADNEAHHEYWHRYREDQPHDQLRAHAHFIQDQVRYFLAALDDPAFLDENGRTLLDNALVVLGTELGNGAAHDFDGVLHGVSSANERFNVGRFFDVEGTAVDFYNTCLSGMGIDRQMGSPAEFGGLLDALFV